jgi:[ribosomal protein S18]-alanine N-acetyltransferase
MNGCLRKYYILMMLQHPGSSVKIREIRSAAQAEKCARLMAGLEPWTTLRRPLRECRRIFSDRTFERYYATVEGRLAGFLVIEMQGTFCGYIKAVCIAPEFRGRGHGASLIRFAEQRIFTESPNVFLCVSSFNRRAQRWYCRRGFRVTGELKDYLIKGHSEILMRKSTGPIGTFKARRVGNRGRGRT